MNTASRNTTAYPLPQSGPSRIDWKSVGRLFLTFSSIVINFMASGLLNVFWGTAVEASSQQVTQLEIPLPFRHHPTNLDISGV